MASRSLDDLEDRIRSSAIILESEAEFIGLDLLIYCTERDVYEQARLYRNGRSLTDIQNKADELADDYQRPDLAEILMEVGPQKGKRVLTSAGPGQSLHNYKLAFDAVPLRDGKAIWTANDDADLALWTDYGNMGVDLGLKWAGNWTTFKELPHMQADGAHWRDFIYGYCH